MPVDPLRGLSPADVERLTLPPPADRDGRPRSAIPREAIALQVEVFDVAVSAWSGDSGEVPAHLLTFTNRDGALLQVVVDRAMALGLADRLARHHLEGGDDADSDRGYGEGRGDEPAG